MQQNYFCTDPFGTSFESYGVVTFSSMRPIESKLIDLPSSMGRKGLFTLYQLKNSQLAVVNVHLESLNTRETRIKQLEIIRKNLEAYPNKIICGDFNFDATRNFDPSDSRKLEQECLQENFTDYIDVWTSLHPDDVGYTFDTTANLMMVNHRPERMRYDRILLSTNLPSPIQCKSIRLFGNEKTNIYGDGMRYPRVFLSDHFGLLATFQT